MACLIRTMWELVITENGRSACAFGVSVVLWIVLENSSSLSVNDTVSCEDLKGVGSLNTTCTLNSSLQLDDDLCISGTGNLEILPHVSIVCPIKGCSITVNVSGNVSVGPSAAIVAGSIAFEANSITLSHDTIINTTSLGGAPPAQTSGTPSSYDGAGGGHGGRGASCMKSNKTLWGGDVYSWSTLSDPWSFGSKGGTASSDKQYGGDGGGRIMLKVNDTLYVDGSVTAEGGEGGLQGGGGSGGSIKVHALKLKGKGTISAAGGRGWGGGGGGRISLNCYSIQDVTVTAHDLFSSTTLKWLMFGDEWNMAQSQHRYFVVYLPWNAKSAGIGRSGIEISHG
ncbi:hypothetical protein Taro_013890 [Colocasia esculenta]|uniref:Uncharacterized protein n=1 Tax=Colocasia esculenta TaxID=4460 RepID=A0A843UDC2_COLES|nr:hypothetical protein [Colocasia esculenta]